MFSVITRSRADPTELTFYIVNGVTGRIAHQFKQFNVSTSHRVCQLFTEQYYVFSTMKISTGTGMFWQELATIELYSKKKEANTWQLILDYFKGHERITADRYSSFAEESDPFVLSQAMMVPFTIKGLTMTETANHITGRDLVLLTDQNRLYEVSQTLFTARRPQRGDIKEPAGWFSLPDPEELEKADQEAPMDIQLKHQSYQVYGTIMPMYDTKYLSYDLVLVGLDKMRTFSTRLESTSQLLAYGHDLWLKRVTPDKKFDMIDEDFEYSLLFLAIGGLMVATYMVRKWIKDLDHRKKFLLH